MIMKKMLMILTFALLILLFFLCTKDKEKIQINYKFDGNSMQIEEYNQSKEDVFLLVDNFLIYRDKYNDTLYLSDFKNGKKPKYISFVPTNRKQFVFNFFRIKNLNKERQKDIPLAFKKMDSSLYNFSNFEKYPFFQIIEPKKIIIIEYKNSLPLEKGKYKIFLDKMDHDKAKKDILLPKKFKILDSNEIEDNPLEFEVK